MTVEISRPTIHDVVTAIVKYAQRCGGEAPRYVVVDTDTALRVVAYLRELYEIDPKRQQVFVAGVEIVAMKTDGLPMIRPVDWPYDEATR